LEGGRGSLPPEGAERAKDDGAMIKHFKSRTQGHAEGEKLSLCLPFIRVAGKNGGSAEGEKVDKIVADSPLFKKKEKRKDDVSAQNAQSVRQKYV